MGFFNDLFNWGAEINEEELTLGRFSDAYKPSSTYNIWESAILAFESEKYMESTQLFLDFLKNPKQENISYVQDDKGIIFEFYQGSKKIQGSINKDSFRAEAQIAKAKSLNIGLMRQLLDKNYLLKYARFALDEENNIVMLFDSYTVDASPNKLYQALKEMAIQADKLDDIIIDEFKDLEHINTSHIIERKELEKDRQYAYLNDKLDECFDEIENGKLNIDQFPGGLSYMLLALNYKLDYLLKPEGFLMDAIEHNHRVYFASDGKEVAGKNNVFIKSFRKIRARKELEIKAELYDVISTFGVTTPSSHENLVAFIDTELSNMEWYKENNHTAIALAIPSYIVGFSLFNNAMPLPDMELLKLFYKVTESGFFYDSEVDNKFVSKGIPSSRAIKNEVEKICSWYLHIYPNLKPDTSILDFTNLVSFSESFLLLVRSLNLSKS